AGSNPVNQVDPSGDLTLKPQPIKFKGCGDYSWGLNLIPGPREKNGFIVQKVTVFGFAINCDTISRLRTTPANRRRGFEINRAPVFTPFPVFGIPFTPIPFDPTDPGFGEFVQLFRWLRPPQTVTYWEMWSVRKGVIMCGHPLAGVFGPG